MPKRRPTRRGLQGLAGQVQPEDGLDARDLMRAYQQQEGPEGNRRRKAWQLCHQVGQTLDAVLAGLDDDVLRNLQVVSVAPAPDSGHLMVTLRVLPGSHTPDVPTILDRLASVSKDLRAEVAAAITRRRAPTLGFQVIPPPT